MSNPIYFFVHIPKTAGSTFGRHLAENFERDEILPVYYGAEYFNAHSGTYEQFQSKEDVRVYLRSLTPALKDKLKIVYGHEVYYGMHEFFDREPRYVTFLRHPKHRVPSAYNHRRYFQAVAPEKPAWQTNAHFRWYWSGVQKDMHQDGELVSFPFWVRHRSVPNYMSVFLAERGFIDDRAEDATRDVPGSIFKKFYFVGTTESFDEEALFLYYQLGIQKFYPDQNISKKYAHTLDLETRDAILERSSRDLALYTAARNQSQNFKQQQRNFGLVVRMMQCKRMLNVYRRTEGLHPLAPLYQLSARLRARSRGYAAAIDRIKQLI